MTSARRSATPHARWSAAFRLSRPDHVLLIVVVYAVGWVAGGHDGGGGRTPPADALLPGLVFALVAVSVHAANEYADVETDALTERTRFSGGSGALAHHGLPAAFAQRVAVLAGAAALVALGAGAAARQISPTVVTLIGCCLVAGWAYSVGPWPFSRHGWGEVVNALLGGLLLPASGAVVAGAPLDIALTTFLPFTLLVFVNMLETQWADRAADRAVGKNTLSSRLSPHALRLLGGTVALTAYGLSAVVQPRPVALAGLLAAPISAYGVWRLGRAGPGPSVVAMLVFLLAQGAAWSF